MSATKDPPAEEGIECGDVLLLLGTSEISKLVAWCSDAVYSHAAIAVDSDHVIEATTKGVVRTEIEKLERRTEDFQYIDAFRSLAPGARELTEQQRAAVRAKAESLLEIPYPINTLATIGVIVAIREKVPTHPFARFLIREALDLLIRDDVTHMMCSEVVYRSLAECDVEPFGQLAPVIVVDDPVHVPFPPIDWRRFLEEVWEIIHPSKRAELAAIADSVAAGTDELAPALAAALSDEEIGERIAAVRRKLDIDAARGALLQPIPVPHPNPKLITPLDLTSTPSHRKLGRLMPSGRG